MKSYDLPIRGAQGVAAREREEANLGESKHVRLRVGVIGLGRLWETRHKPSLARLQDRFRITAVYDQVYRRAEIEADQLDCAACEGLAALVERPDVDVIYLLSPQWFGLHPAHLACAAGKAVYCGLPLAGDQAELESLIQRVDETGIAFMPEFARRCYPATLRLKELLGDLAGTATAHSRPFPTLRFRSLRGSRSDHPDLTRTATDRSGKLSHRLVRVPDAGVADVDSRNAVSGAPLRGR